MNLNQYVLPTLWKQSIMLTNVTWDAACKLFVYYTKCSSIRYFTVVYLLFFRFFTSFA